MTPDLLLSALLVFLVVFGGGVLWRFSNATFTLTWASKTSHPEPSDAETAELTRQRDEARFLAERLRGELRERDTVPPDE